jgi:ribbon-helix-helix protein
MRRLVQLAVLISVVAFVLRRMRVSVGFGVVILNDRELARLATNPVSLNVVGMVAIPPGTSPDLVASAVRSLNVFGLLEGDQDAIMALRGRTRIFGAVHSRDS